MEIIQYAIMGIVILGYLLSLGWALKEAHYQTQRNNYLVKSNRELQSENQYYRTKI
jgi:hypothetical protein